MGEITVSIIVPVYKVENFLSHCITSILNQTYTNLEIILVHLLREIQVFLILLNNLIKIL